MPDVLAVTAPVYLLILAGYAATRFGLFAKPDLRVLGKFVLNLALPALLFNALAQRPLREVAHPAFLLAYLTGSVIVIAAGYAWWRRARGLPRSAAGIHAMGMGCANTAFVGNSILVLMLPDLAGLVLALCLLVENGVLFPLVLVLAERGRGSATGVAALRTALVGMARNPLSIALAAGLAAAATGWTLPAPLAHATRLLALSTSAVSLFVIGGTLVGLHVGRWGRTVAPVAVAKLVVHPLLVALAVLALPLLGVPSPDPVLRWVVVLMAAMPMVGVYPILAQAYGEEEMASAAMLVTTTASFATLSILLWALPQLAA
jgi:predicted permease